ncbi:MAG TPA: hypothetical protein VGQ22_15305 [Steroidobacteraceae bacterium]|nr:hypothetical protein [Steroidobacteraceae bacterium]
MNATLATLIRHALTGATLAVATTVAAAQPGTKVESKARTVPLSAATMIIEYNSSAEDIGVQFFLDLSEGWRDIEIFDPSGREIFGAETEGRLTRQGGGTELFLESVEPPIADLPFEKFFRRFPEGTYRFRGHDPKGNRITGEAEFTHDIPAGPEILLPRPAPGAECAVGVPSRGAVVAWNPVTQSIDDEPLNIVRYEVIVENDDLNFDVKYPAQTGTMLTVSLELLQPGTDYIGEVLAVEEGGNQTITEFCFRTAQ